MDRNETVSSSYAASIGYVSRLATDTQMLKTVAFARQLYFGDEESDRARYTAGEILQAMAKYATDRFNALASDILPFVFFGKFDDEKRVRDIFTETYNETASGPRAATLYLAEIVKVANDNLASKRWTFKHAAALSISEAIKAVATSQSSITKSQGEILWPSLQSALAEKSWDGKEKVLEGFVMIVEKGGEFWRCRPDMGQELIKVRHFSHSRNASQLDEEHDAVRRYPWQGIDPLTRIRSRSEKVDAATELTSLLPWPVWVRLQRPCRILIALMMSTALSNHYLRRRKTPCRLTTARTWQTSIKSK